MKHLKLLPFFCLLSVLNLHAVEFGNNGSTHFRELTNPDYKSDSISENKLPNEELIPYQTRKFELFTNYCESARQLRDQIKDYPNWKKKKYFSKLISLENNCYIKTHIDFESSLNAFIIENENQNAINYKQSRYDSSRMFKFSFEKKSKQVFKIAIRDDVGISGKLSSDFMETELIFIPRKVVPYINLDRSNLNVFSVILPTNEEVLFSIRTKEIVGGVLKEKSIDFNPNKYKRNFAQFDYSGNGIIIRVDRRGGLPTKSHAAAFNINENPKMATILHKGKECLVAKDLIWKNTHGREGKVIFKFNSDQDFLDLIVNPHCQWNLTLSDIE